MFNNSSKDKKEKEKLFKKEDFVDELEEFCIYNCDYKKVISYKDVSVTHWSNRIYILYKYILIDNNSDLYKKVLFKRVHIGENISIEREAQL